MNFTNSQVSPPSRVRYMPRSGLESQMWPSAATCTMSGFVGCTMIRAMTWVASKPMRFHISPPSVDLKIPPPGEIELRESSSPVPT